MAGKKDFSKLNTNRVYSQIDEATAEPAEEQQEISTPQTQEVHKERKTYTAQEQQHYMQEGRTRGRKGCRMSRINMAFTPDVHRYITVMSRVKGQTITDFTNSVFEEHMRANAATYQRAQEFIENME